MTKTNKHDRHDKCLSCCLRHNGLFLDVLDKTELSGVVDVYDTSLLCLLTVRKHLSCLSYSFVRRVIWFRDRHETLKLKTETLTSRDRDVGLTGRDETKTRRSNFEMRPKRNICRSRDVTETLK